MVPPLQEQVLDVMKSLSNDVPDIKSKRSTPMGRPLEISNGATYECYSFFTHLIGYAVAFFPSVIWAEIEPPFMKAEKQIPVPDVLWSDVQ